MFAVTLTEGMSGELALLNPTAELSDNTNCAPDCAITLAVQFMLPIPTLSTLNDCGGTTPPPATAVKVKPVCESLMIWGTELIVMVTGIIVVVPSERFTV